MLAQQLVGQSIGTERRSKRIVGIGPMFLLDLKHNALTKRILKK
jgi:hypothetical protein